MTTLSNVGASLRQYIAGGEFVANRELVFGDRAIKVGERVPWRELGVHEVHMHQFWRANIVDCVPKAVLAAERATAAKPQRQARK